LTGVKSPAIVAALGFALDFRHNSRMLVSRRFTRIFAWLAAVCLLFAQTAAAAYACSRADAAAPTEVASPCPGHVAANAPAGPQGDGVLAQGNVCEVHCQAASLPDGGLCDLPAVVVIARWEVPALAIVSGATAPAPELEARSAAPPLLTLFPRLLI
jgi:hypothetical protein